MTTPASTNRFKGVTFQPQSTPATPATDDGRLFLDTADGLLKWIDDAGTVTEVTLGPSGGGLTDPMTTRGDMIIRNASNVTARLGKGSAGQVLTSDGTDIAWSTPSSGGITQAYVGYNAIGGTVEDAVAFRQICTQITLAQDRLITSVEAYLQMDTGPDTFGLFVGVWADNANTIGKQLALGGGFGAGSAQSVGAPADVAATDPRWWATPLGYWAAAGTYWVGILTYACGFGANRLNLYYDGSGSDRRLDTGAAYTADGAAFSQTNTTRKYSIRANTIR